ncbi:hypothetical protein JCM19235_554 [Vibrio maritimus]|uniref:Uncharacterized protein n=1 Tax=Vibrio maritimus TaxID=990268 RepID=A0A090S9A4_9VIBR|nr:hypothetical protein JCM19235_554 [Vibrio maritimus]
MACRLDDLLPLGTLLQVRIPFADINDGFDYLFSFIDQLMNFFSLWVNIFYQ